jgi:Eco57I restriction-modification methylase
METKYLKKYAPEARRDFIAAVTNKAAVYGLLPKAVLPMQEDGDVVIIGDRPFPRAVAKQRRELEMRINQRGFASFIESSAYTWFNRFVAIRFMELHGYLSHGYRVLSHPSGGNVPEVMEYAERLDLPGLDRDAVIDLKLDGQKDDLLYQMLLLAQCNALHELMPFMFEKVDDATELLLPDNLLHTESLVRKLVDGLPPENLEDIEAVGWLYQFYISEKKDDVFAALKKGNKITPENIPAATQLFTPHWIVRYLVENSLGRLWMLNHPDSRLVEQMDYYIRPEEPETDFLRISSPEEIKICDPACGSGHMLTYAFDLLYAIYEEQGYQATDIPRLILTHNLYGIEIDQRAGALAAFALTMKAREKYRRFLSAGKVVQPNICVLENIQVDPEDLSAYMDKVSRDLFSGRLQGVVNQWEEADNFGSLIRPLVTDVSEVLELLRERQMDEDLFLAGVHQKVLKALRQADYLSPKYHVVVANPPYMGAKGMTDRLKTLGKKNFPKSKADLYSMFMDRLMTLGLAGSQLGLMTPFTWMFLLSHSDIRDKVLHEGTITTLVRPEYHAFFDSAFVPVCAFTMVTVANPNQNGTFIDLNEFYGADQQPIRLLEAINNPAVGYRHTAAPVDFDKIPGMPLAFWVSDRVRSVFENNPQMKERADSKQGLATANNGRFMRRWWEVSLGNLGIGLPSAEEASASGLRWFPLNKGGPFRKWYGNHEFVINWRDNGAEVRAYVNERYPYLKGNIDYVIKDRGKYFLESVSWSDITAASNAFRYYPEGFLYDHTGHSAFCDSRDDMLVLLSFANNVFCTSAARMLNPTMHFHLGNFDVLPWPKTLQSSVVRPIVESLIQLSREDWNERELSWEFGSLPMLDDQVTLETAYNDQREKNRNRISEVKQLETKNNEAFLGANGLTDEFESAVPDGLVTLNCNPLHRYGSDKSESELEALLLADTMREFISYAVGCMLGRYSLDKPGLILANQGETADDYRQQIPKPTFAPDEDNVIPLLDGDWFTDDISERFKEFLKVTFGTEHYEENLTFLENALYPENGTGKRRKTIRDYFLKEFYNHHIKLYKKRPIYWLFSSGKQKAFQALIYLHRYNPSTLSRMRTEYVVKLHGKFNARLEQLDDDILTAGSTSHRKKLEKARDTLTKQREELQSFDEKLRHYADQRIEIDLDDGVKVNYGKFGDLLAGVKAITGKTPAT